MSNLLNKGKIVSIKNDLKFYRRKYNLICECFGVRSKEALRLWEKIIEIENRLGM